MPPSKPSAQTSQIDDADNRGAVYGPRKLTMALLNAPAPYPITG
jgi:hypothetical protein